MQADVASGALHPMEAKKRLARTIVAGFHSDADALAADEGWARMFQQRDVSEDLEEVSLSYDDLVGPSSAPGLQIRVTKLLLKAGLASSGAEASRKLAENAIKIHGQVVTNSFFALESLPARLTVRIGKRAKLAVIQ